MSVSAPLVFTCLESAKRPACPRAMPAHVTYQLGEEQAAEAPPMRMGRWGGWDGRQVGATNSSWQAERGGRELEGQHRDTYVTERRRSECCVMARAASPAVLWYGARAPAHAVRRGGYAVLHASTLLLRHRPIPSSTTVQEKIGNCSR